MWSRIAFVIIVATYAVLGHRNAAIWHSDLTLWSHAMTVGTPTDRARSNYAKALYASSRESEAFDLFSVTR